MSSCNICGDAAQRILPEWFECPHFREWLQAELDRVNEKLLYRYSITDGIISFEPLPECKPRKPTPAPVDPPTGQVPRYLQLIHLCDSCNQPIEGCNCFDYPLELEWSFE